MTKAERPLWQTALSKALSGVDAKFVTVEFEVDGKTAEVRIKPDSLLNGMNLPLKASDCQIQKRYKEAAETLGVGYLRCKHISRIKYRGVVLYEHISKKRAKRLTVEADGKLYLNDVPIGSSKKCFVVIEGNLDLSSTAIKSLPNNFMVVGYLDLSYTPIELLPDNLVVGGSLELSDTNIRSLPNGLMVEGSLDLSCTPITSIPANLVVGGSFYLSHTSITSIPANLVVEANLDLSNTPITSIPANLVVGGSLYLEGTSIKSLPNGLVVGGSLYLRNTSITSLPDNLLVGEFVRGGYSSDAYKRLQNGDYVPGRYLYADGILTHVKSTKTVGKYTLYIGKIKRRNVVYDGEYYAHCRNLRDGIADILYKRAKDRGAEQYKGLTLDSELTVEDAATMYRIITGACKQGTEQFIASRQKRKEKYSIRELIKLTKGRYNSHRFAEFFGAN